MTAERGSGALEQADTKFFGQRGIDVIVVMITMNVRIVIARANVKPIYGI